MLKRKIETVLTIPLYMGFLIVDKLTDVIVPEIDLSSLIS